MKLNFLAFLFCFVQLKLIQSADITPVVDFVTETDVDSAAGEVNYFHLRLCGGELYDGHRAIVYINQPNKPWNPTISDFVKVIVNDSNGREIASNRDSAGNYNNTFTFNYNKTEGDLTIIATTGESTGGMLYTLTVRFLKGSVTRSHQSRIRRVSTDNEVLRMEAFKRSNPGHTYELVSIILLERNGSVHTQQADIVTLNYCFNPQEFPGKIQVSVVAMDDISGFGTYVCPAHIHPCTTESTPYRDISGAAVNFVTAVIKQAEDAGPVEVIVRGDGRYQKANVYRLAASKFMAT